MCERTLRARTEHPGSTGGWVGTSNLSTFEFSRTHGPSGRSGYYGSTTGPTGVYSNLAYNEFEYDAMSGIPRNPYEEQQLSRSR